MAAPTLFDFLKQLNETGGNPLFLEDEECEKAYTPFIINRGIAQSISTVMFASEANKEVIADKRMHFSYLFHSLKKSKRYAKWAKKTETSEEVLMVSEYYQVSLPRAEEIVGLSTPQQLADLKARLDTGGQMGRGKK